MTKAVSAFKEGITRLTSNGEILESRRKISNEVISDLERRLGVHLPPSYCEMIREFGVLAFEGFEFYGVTASGFDAKGAPNVVFATEEERKREHITDQMVHFMDAGYGPSFVLDCSQLDIDGEAPVVEIAPGGIKNGMDRLSDSFGEFFLAEISAYLDDVSDTARPVEAAAPDAPPGPNEIAEYWRKRAEDFEK